MGKVKTNNYEVYLSKNKTSHRASKIIFVSASTEKKAKEVAKELWPEMHVKEARFYGESLAYKEIGKAAVKKAKADEKSQENSVMNGIQNAKGGKR